MSETGKLRIMQVIPSLLKGGAERLVLDICRQLHNRADVEYLLVTFRDDTAYEFLHQDLHHQIVHAEVMPSITSKGISNIHEFIHVIEKFKPDVIHSHLFEAEMVSREKVFPNVLYVTHLHDNMPQFRNIKPGMLNKKMITNYYEKRRILKKYKQCRNHFIAISHDTYDYFKECLPTELHQISLMANAIDNSRFSKLENRPITEKRLELVSTGSLYPKKNQAFLTDVVEMLVKSGIDTHLTLLGEGPERKKIEEKIKQQNLQAHITLKGNVDHVEDYLEDASIYVHAAWYEPYGLALLEAMAAGLPCIALDGKGNRDVMIEGENGYLIPQADLALFADKIKLLLDQEGLYDKISNAARAFAWSKDISKYTEQLLELYKEERQKREFLPAF